MKPAPPQSGKKPFTASGWFKSTASSAASQAERWLFTIGSRTGRRRLWRRGKAKLQIKRLPARKPRYQKTEIPENRIPENRDTGARGALAFGSGIDRLCTPEQLGRQELAFPTSSPTHVRIATLSPASTNHALVAHRYMAFAGIKAYELHLVSHFADAVQAVLEEPGRHHPAVRRSS